MAILSHNVLMIVPVSGMLLLQWELRPQHTVASLLLAGAVLVASSVVRAFVSPVADFGTLQLVAWPAFAHYPLFLLGAAYLLLGQKRGVALASATLAAGLLAIFVDAFPVEPRWLEVTHVTIPTGKLWTAVLIAVIADLQTDTLRRYEERVLRRVSAEEPDLILLAGDYLHVAD